MLLDNLITAGNAGAEEVYPNIEFVEHNVIEPFDWGDSTVIPPLASKPLLLQGLSAGNAGGRDHRHPSHAGTCGKARCALRSFPPARYTETLTPSTCRCRKVIAVTFPPGRCACYDESKRVKLCYIFHTNNGTHTNVIRPFNVYGPGMQKPTIGCCPTLPPHQTRDSLKVYGSGTQTRTFCYITDHGRLHESRAGRCHRRSL